MGVSLKSISDQELLGRYNSALVEATSARVPGGSGTAKSVAIARLEDELAARGFDVCALAAQRLTVEAKGKIKRNLSAGGVPSTSLPHQKLMHTPEEKEAASKGEPGTKETGSGSAVGSGANRLGSFKFSATTMEVLDREPEIRTFLERQLSHLPDRAARTIFWAVRPRQPDLLGHGGIPSAVVPPGVAMEIFQAVVSNRQVSIDEKIEVAGYALLVARFMRGPQPSVSFDAPASQQAQALAQQVLHDPRAVSHPSAVLNHLFELDDTDPRLSDWGASFAGFIARWEASPRGEPHELAAIEAAAMLRRTARVVALDPAAIRETALNILKITPPAANGYEDLGDLVRAALGPRDLADTKCETLERELFAALSRRLQSLPERDYAKSKIVRGIERASKQEGALPATYLEELTASLP